MWNGSLWNAGLWNGSGGDVEFILIPPPTVRGPLRLHIVDMIQVRATLEAWNMLVANGLSDTMVANSDSVEDIELEARLLVGHIEYERLLVRSRLMLRRAEEMGVLTDADIAGALTTAEITAILTALNGEADGDIYSAFFQGT
jgi:hypothetical protein